MALKKCFHHHKADLIYFRSNLIKCHNLIPICFLLMTQMYLWIDVLCTKKKGLKADMETNRLATASCWTMDQGVQS